MTKFFFRTKMKQSEHRHQHEANIVLDAVPFDKQLCIGLGLVKCQ